MDAFETYQRFLAIRNHFYNDYDYFKYNGKMNVSFDKFMTRKDRFYFHKLGKRNDPVGYIVANILLSNSKIWITDLNTEESDEKYLEWQKYKESETYIFKEELKKIEENFKDRFIVKEGQHPQLLRDYMQGTISIYTLTILDIILDFTKYWNNKIEDVIIWPEINTKIQKFKPFLSIKKDQYKKIIIDIIT